MSRPKTATEIFMAGRRPYGRSQCKMLQPSRRDPFIRTPSPPPPPPPSVFDYPFPEVPIPSTFHYRYEPAYRQLHTRDLKEFDPYAPDDSFGMGSRQGAGDLIALSPPWQIRHRQPRPILPTQSPCRTPSPRAVPPCIPPTSTPRRTPSPYRPPPCIPPTSTPRRTPSPYRPPPMIPPTSTPRRTPSPYRPPPFIPPTSTPRRTPSPYRPPPQILPTSSPRRTPSPCLGPAVPLPTSSPRRTPSPVAGPSRAPQPCPRRVPSPVAGPSRAPQFVEEDDSGSGSSSSVDLKQLVERRLLVHTNELFEKFERYYYWQAGECDDPGDIDLSEGAHELAMELRKVIEKNLADMALRRISSNDEESEGEEAPEEQIDEVIDLRSPEEVIDLCSSGDSSDVEIIEASPPVPQPTPRRPRTAGCPRRRIPFPRI